MQTWESGLNMKVSLSCEERRSLRVRNTFLELPPERSSSLEPFLRRRSTRSFSSSPVRCRSSGAWPEIKGEDAACKCSSPRSTQLCESDLDTSVDTSSIDVAQEQADMPDVIGTGEAEIFSGCSTPVAWDLLPCGLFYLPAEPAPSACCICYSAVPYGAAVSAEEAAPAAAPVLGAGAEPPLVLSLADALDIASAPSPVAQQKQQQSVEEEEGEQQCENWFATDVIEDYTWQQAAFAESGAYMAYPSCTVAGEEWAYTAEWDPSSSCDSNGFLQSPWPCDESFATTMCSTAVGASDQQQFPTYSEEGKANEMQSWTSAVPVVPTSPPPPPSEPAPGTQELPSVGSAGHAAGTCRPCAFVQKGGCENGAGCRFCHLCNSARRRPGKVTKTKKQKASS